MVSDQSTRIDPVRFLLVGAGSMGRGWVRNVAANPEAVLVGIVDLEPGTAAAAAGLYAEHGGGAVPSGDSLSGLAASTHPDAVIDVTVPRAHHAVTVEALRLGLPVLGEKPAAGTLAEALSLAATVECTGGLFMVSQSRRYNTHFLQLRRLARALAPIGMVTHTFARAPHFGGFRDQMDDPLLVDMAIHPFDAARTLLEGHPASVYCESFNPPWSWYRGDAAAAATFEFDGGARFVYSGSWCSAGLETSWNGSWRVSGARGTALWDGDNPPRGTAEAGTELTPDPSSSEPLGIAGSLVEFIAALRTGDRPQGEIHDNVFSLAMVEAAVRSARTGRRIRIADLLDEARRTAIEAERHDDVRERLRSWTGPVGEHPVTSPPPVPPA